jgi:hypothetical protein
LYLENQHYSYLGDFYNSIPAIHNEAKISSTTATNQEEEEDEDNEDDEEEILNIQLMPDIENEDTVVESDPHRMNHEVEDVDDLDELESENTQNFLHGPFYYPFGYNK